MIPDLNQPVENPKLKALLNKRATAPQEAQLDVVNEIACLSLRIGMSSASGSLSRTAT